jgi:Flp pilus assembly protein TadD
MRVVSVCVAVALLWGVTTATRIGVWGNELTIWQEAVRVSPHKPRPWVNLGRMLAQTGRPDAAAAAYHWASVVSTNRPPLEARIGRGMALVNLGILRLETDHAGGMLLIQEARQSGVIEIDRLARWLEQR